MPNDLKKLPISMLDLRRRHWLVCDCTYFGHFLSQIYDNVQQDRILVYGWIPSAYKFMSRKDRSVANIINILRS